VSTVDVEPCPLEQAASANARAAIPIDADRTVPRRMVVCRTNIALSVHEAAAENRTRRLQ